MNDLLIDYDRDNYSFFLNYNSKYQIGLMHWKTNATTHMHEYKYSTQMSSTEKFTFDFREMSVQANRNDQ